MSVINKMLRDLDSRQPTPAAGATRPLDGSAGLTAGTVALGSRSATSGAPTSPSGRSLRVGLLILAAVLVAGLGWWASQRPEAVPVSAVPPAQSAPAAQAQVTATAPVAQPPVISPIVVAPEAATPAQPAASAVTGTSTIAAVPTGVDAPAKAAAPILAAAPAAREPAPVVATPAKPAAPKPVEAQAAAKALPAKPFAGQLKEETELSPLRLANRLGAQSAAMVPRAVASTGAAGGPDVPKTRQPAAQEVLAQAQERWNLGERAPAISLLQGAITRLEGSGASEASALASLTREYVRMTLAQGQASAASAMLTRLEQPLAGVADIWALRGNVAQRLGHHPEAVRAYLKSLELRPNEPRWMLGAAVSLAAQGQVGPAGDLAEQARQAGALRPDVANYLRQLGVAVRPD
ncbi:hypothetical protein HUU62_07550 [Rhodoferax sp. 4810]|nr:hypothetical protein [Rhodoferax jenense]